MRHEENLREHYALTLRGLVRATWWRNWDECVRRGRRGHREGVGPLHGRLAAVGFERNEIQLHQVLAVKPDADGNAALPAAPDLAGLSPRAGSRRAAGALPVPCRFPR